MKPVVNIDDLELENCGEGLFSHSYGVICAKIGAQKLGYNLTVVPSNHKANFFHNHHANEEMFFVIEGSGILRFGQDEYPLKKFDVVACPPGKRDRAHQIINTGNTELKYLSLSTKERVEVVEFPDSDKVAVMVGDYEKVDLHGIFKNSSKVEHDEGES